MKKLNLMENEAPIATRLRSRSKVGGVQASQTEPIGRIVVNNQSGQRSRNKHDKAKNSTANSEIHISSGQPSTEQRTKKSNDSTSEKNVHFLSTSRTSQPSKGAKNSKDSTPRKSDVQVSSPGSQTPKQQNAKNSEDSIAKRSEIQISSSCKTRTPSKDQAANNSKDSTPKKSGIPIKQLIKNEHAKGKDSQSKSEINDSSHRRRSQFPENKETKSMSSTPKKSDIIKPFISDAGQEKQMTGVTRPLERLVKQFEEEARIYYIRWKGFEKPTERTGWNCEVCKKDLVHSSVEEELEHSLPAEDELGLPFFLEEEGEEEGESFEHSLLPEVTVLPCSHVFHSMCLRSEEQLNGPPCPICSRLP